MDTRNDRANRKYNNLFRLENELYHDIAVKMGLSDSAFGILYWLCLLYTSPSPRDCS